MLCALSSPLIIHEVEIQYFKHSELKIHNYKQLNQLRSTQDWSIYVTLFKHCFGFILPAQEKSLVQATWILNIHADIYPYV